MNKQNIIEYLLNDLQYPQKAAEVVAEKLCAASPTIQNAFTEYRDTGNIPEICIENYSVEKLQREHGMNEIAALLTLDWLMREPEKAKASLRKGHDTIKKRRSN
jgi:hypothetical protein